jgi:beta-1,2-xylosyltransferase
MNSLIPFYGLPIDTLHDRLMEAETIPETFTLIVHDGMVELQWNDDYARHVWSATSWRADNQMKFMAPFIRHLGDFRCVCCDDVISGCLLTMTQSDVHHSRPTLNTVGLDDTARSNYCRQTQSKSVVRHHQGIYPTDALTSAWHQPDEEDRFEQDWHKACSPDSRLNSGEKELRGFPVFRTV